MDLSSPKELYTTEWTTQDEPHSPEVTPGREEEKRGTNFDQQDMLRMGKRQETRARFFLQTKLDNADPFMSSATFDS